MKPEHTTLLLGFLRQLIEQCDKELSQSNSFELATEELNASEGITELDMLKLNRQTLERLYVFFESHTNKLDPVDYVLAWGELSQLRETCSAEERPILEAVMKELRATVREFDEKRSAES